MIDKVNSELCGGDNDGGLKSHKMMYEQKLGTYGKSSCDTIREGLTYAKALKNHHHGVESETLLTKLYDISKRYQSDHEITQSVNSLKSHCYARVVSVSSNEASNHETVQALSFKDYDDDDVPRYHFLEYDGSFDRCVIEGPITYDGGPTNKTSLSTDDIIFALGTPVICHGLDYIIDGELGDIRSWDSESKCYTVHWEDESLEPCEVHQSNVRVSKCICDECIQSLLLQF